MTLIPHLNLCFFCMWGSYLVSDNKLLYFNLFWVMPKKFKEKSQKIVGQFKNDIKWGLMIFFSGDDGVSVKQLILTCMSWIYILLV